VTITDTEPRQTFRACPLNPIELSIVRHLADGDTRAQTARAVGLQPMSMNTTVSRIFNRVGAVSATNLVAIALRNGWIR
jgi:DNA-binding CsgD family transcriptional regulator